MKDGVREKWYMANGQMADRARRWQMADGKWQVVNGRWQMANGRAGATCWKLLVATLNTGDGRTGKIPIVPREARE